MAAMFDCDTMRRCHAAALIGAALGASACGGAPAAAPAAPPVAERCEPGSGGNPFVAGWYADPDMRVYDGVYWVFPTYSAPYDEQTFLDAFSSPDLVHWTKHARVLDTSGVRWARRAMWAPSPIARDGKYFLYFGANDIQSDQEVGGIGVAIADQPGGPYRDGLGQPLIGRFANGAQPIDQDVFIDDDGQAYLYYGGWQHCNVVKLNRDMTSLGTFADGTQFREITPPGYVEGALMFKRRGVYYLMWSEGGWTGPDYRVSYAMASSPLGPFARRGTILAQDAAIATGSGHNTVVNVPGTDEWYIFYHRHPLGDRDGNHRMLAYDRMAFAADGTIAPVTMAVRDSFCDDDAVGWTSYGGDWHVRGGRYATAAAAEAKSMMTTAYSALVFDADVTVDGTGAAGVVFRAHELSVGVCGYRGYHAVIEAGTAAGTKAARGRVVLGKCDGRVATELASASAAIGAGQTHHLRVVANGHRISVALDGGAPVTANDSDDAGGATGVIARGAAASFDNVRISNPPGGESRWIAPR